MHVDLKRFVEHCVSKGIYLAGAVLAIVAALDGFLQFWTTAFHHGVMGVLTALALVAIHVSRRARTQPAAPATAVPPLRVVRPEDPAVAA